jgi:hypothetical protein
MHLSAAYVFPKGFLIVEGLDRLSARVAGRFGGKLSRFATAAMR